MCPGAGSKLAGRSGWADGAAGSGAEANMTRELPPLLPKGLPSDHRHRRRFRRSESRQPLQAPRVGRSLATVFATPSIDIVQHRHANFHLLYLQPYGGSNGIRRCRMSRARSTVGCALLERPHRGSLERPRVTLARMVRRAHVRSDDIRAGGPTNSTPVPAFRVELRPSDLHSAGGVIRTVHGGIAAEWKRDARTFELQVRIPMASRVELSVPGVDLGATRLTGERGAEGTDLPEGCARSRVIGPGSFRVKTVLSAATPKEGDR